MTLVERRGERPGTGGRFCVHGSKDAWGCMPPWWIVMGLHAAVADRGGAACRRGGSWWGCMPPWRMVMLNRGA
eukprot:351634-Chlamydomonas_euryale.AAC.1